MFTEAQILYLEEVLGASVDSFRATLPARAPATAEVVVLTPPITPDEKVLLNKILGSIQLNTYTHAIAGEADLGGAAHVLDFTGAREAGRHEQDGAVWWSLPALTLMLGAGPEVTALKKNTWALLQQFHKECS